MFIFKLKFVKSKKLKDYLISPDIKKFNNFFPKLKIAVLASGEGSNLQVLIDLMKQRRLDISIEILISNNENAGCLKRAYRENIQTLICKRSNYSSNEEFENEIINALKENEIELIVMAGWMKIVTNSFVDNFKNKIINIHPSILPSYKGKTPIKDSLESGSLITGCSVHYVIPEVDSGRIIIQGAIPIKKEDDLSSLTKKIHNLEHKILPLGVSIAGKSVRN